ncbi:MAG: Rrf2 family transcriptional regulator [Chitinophagales bacterium]|nr:Rrf2 family transcriptional regulator [Chitinophagales bacterium]
MKIFSNGTIYALRALIFIVSKQNKQEYTSLSEVSNELKISFHFLTKSLQKLTKEGVLTSSRGPAGGVALAKPADTIPLIDVVLILEGPEYFDSCILGLPGCGKEAPCPLHEFWFIYKSKLMQELTKVSLADLGNKTLQDRLRLTQE